MTTLKPKQQQFVNALIDAGHTTSPIPRSVLVSVANSLGSNYAPAWIVKDASRKAGNACFNVPEVEGGTAPAPVATPKRSTRRASAPAPAAPTTLPAWS